MIERRLVASFAHTEGGETSYTLTKITKGKLGESLTITTPPNAIVLGRTYRVTVELLEDSSL